MQGSGDGSQAVTVGSTAVAHYQYRVTAALVVVTCAAAPAYGVPSHPGPVPPTLLDIAAPIPVGSFVAAAFRPPARPGRQR